MDNKQDILELLRKVAEGKVSPEDAMLDLKEAPFEDLDYAKIDFHRSVRQGAAEVREKQRSRSGGLYARWEKEDAGISW